MTRLPILFLCTLVTPGGPAAAADSPARPNVVIFYLDDLGYGDPACYGGKLTPTPHIDSLARNGVRFTDGYVAACVCSPSRVGLMTGRYQQRTGHDANTGRAGSELARTETLFPQRLKAADYATAIVGKWHLGSSTEFLPGSRGFDVAFGSVGNLGEGKGPEFYRGASPAEKPAEAPITSPAYAREACKFIESQRARPFFLYLAFNAVHNPNVASEDVLERLKHLPRREQQYAASLAEADDAIGTVLAKLRELKLEDNTLIFFLSDNGHSSPQANNDGLRGGKWLLWEGGIRVPFIVQWKGRIPGGRVVNEPVIQLDVLPTVLAAAGVEVRPEWQLDGVNLLPLLQGQTASLKRDALYWRFGVQFAIRQGDWKLVKPAKDASPLLFNLAADRGESHDLSEKQPEKARSLLAQWEKWNAQMQSPRWEDRRWDGEEARQVQKQKKKKKAN